VRRRAAGQYEVSVRVTNTGQRPGAEVVQLYVGFPDSIEGPPNQLKGFAKVTLDPGKSRRAKIKLDPSSFAHWSTTGSTWVVEPGTYALRVGTSSRNLVLERKVAIQPSGPDCRRLPSSPPSRSQNRGSRIHTRQDCELGRAMPGHRAP